MIRRAPQEADRFDAEPTLAAARAALERGPTLVDVPTLALAGARSKGDELGLRLQPFLRVWSEGPPALAADLPEASTLLEVALELGEVLLALRRELATPVSKDDLKRHREYGMRLCRERQREVGAEELEGFVRTAAEAERQDHIRIARGRVAGVELRFADAIRLCWSAPKNGGRP